MRAVACIRQTVKRGSPRSCARLHLNLSRRNCDKTLIVGNYCCALYYLYTYIHAVIDKLNCNLFWIICSLKFYFFFVDRKKKWFVETRWLIKKRLFDLCVFPVEWLWSTLYAANTRARRFALTSRRELTKERKSCSTLYILLEALSPSCSVILVNYPLISPQLLIVGRPTVVAHCVKDKKTKSSTSETPITLPARTKNPRCTIIPFYTSQIKDIIWFELITHYFILISEL